MTHVQPTLSAIVITRNEAHLLTRTELRVVMQVTTTPDVVRVAARDLAERRPPTSTDVPSGEA